MNVFMTGEAGDFNYGDHGMALATWGRIRRYFPDAAITATALYPETSVLRELATCVSWPISPRPRQSYSSRLRDRLGLPARPVSERTFEQWFQHSYAAMPETRSAIKRIEESAFVLDMGHGGINDIFGDSLFPYFYWLCKRLDKPLFVSGQTIGPLTNAAILAQYGCGLPHAHSIILRDEDVSKSELNTILPPRSKTIVTEAGDDTLDFEPGEPDWNLFPSATARAIKSRQYFVVHWRPTDYSRNFGPSDYSIIASRVAHLASRFGYQPLFIPMAWEAKSDIASSVMISALLPKGHSMIAVNAPIGASATKWIIRYAQFGIGLSYHFLVWLLSQGRPAIAVHTNAYYELKARGAANAYGFPEAVTSFAQLASHSSLDVERTIEGWTESDSSALQEKATILRLRWHAAFTRFLSDHSLGGLIEEETD